jgi:flagellar biosynthesis chaperone FliJ
MKRFTWRLQRVLDVKQKEEQIKRAALLAVTEKLVLTKNELYMQKKILKKLIDELSAQSPKNRLSKQQFFLNCSITNDKIIKSLINAVTDLETQKKEKLAELIKIKRYNEGLEKLRIEAKSKFIKEQETLEQKDSDDLTTIRFARKIKQETNADNCINRNFVECSISN